MSIYLDYAATTPMREEVLEAMLPYLTDHFGNASSLHAEGRRARQGVDEARERIAAIIGAKPREIVFTSGGSEADNLAIKGAAWAASARGRHIVTSSVEHNAVLNACAILERSGFEVTYLPVDRYGRVAPAEVAAAITDRTALVSIMYANNEVGTIQPIAEIGAICRRAGVVFHTDAVQAGACLPLDVDRLAVDLLTLSAHKVYGPKGVGALFVRQGTALLPQVQGGAQERQRRAGTENVAGIVGFARALDLVQGDPAARDAENARLAALRERLFASVRDLDDVVATGHPVERLPHNASWLIGGVEGGDLIAALDLGGVAASTGSACISGSAEPSHVLLAMGFGADAAHGALRLTAGRSTTSSDIDQAAEVLLASVARLREQASPRPEVASA